MNRDEFLRYLFPRQEGQNLNSNRTPPTTSQEEIDRCSASVAVEEGTATSPAEKDLNAESWNDKICVICLEKIDECDFVLGSFCQHFFHYDCLMEWMTKGHDDCPTCRQLLWDVEKFETLVTTEDGQDRRRCQRPRSDDGVEGLVLRQEARRRQFEINQILQEARRRQMEPVPQSVPGISWSLQTWRTTSSDFSWSRVCCFINLLLFVAGSGYIVGYIVSNARN